MGINDSPTKAIEIAESFGIPNLQTKSTAWFVRTTAGLFYNDFVQRSYIAIGWDDIESDLLYSDSLSDDQKQEMISELYPSKGRPGLIKSQLNTFLSIMKSGDFVAIPNRGGQKMAIGVLEEDNIFCFDSSEENLNSLNDVVKCPYKRRRKIKWLREIVVSNDIYLVKIQRAHQTISRIDKYMNILFRNLFDVFILDDRISLTLRYSGRNALGFDNQLALMESINNIFFTVNKINPDIKKDSSFEVRISVSSPGFMEILSNITPSAIYLMIFLVFIMGGKLTKTPADFSLKTNGLAGMLSALSDFFDRKLDRKIKREAHNLDSEIKRLEVYEKKKELGIIETLFIENEQVIILEESQDKISEVMKSQAISAPNISDDLK